MGEVTSVCTFKRDIPGKLLRIESDATVDDGDTILVTLADYGFKTVEAVAGYAHTTTDSIIVAEQPTTSVTAGVLTITVGGATDNLKRVYLVYGDSN